MKDLVEQLVRYLRGMWHRRWIGVACAWVAALVGVAIVYNIPERFEAQARVFVDTESLLKPLLAGLVISPNVDQQVALMSRTLISRPNVERLVRMADLDVAATSPQKRDDLIDDVMKTIRLNSVSTNLYTISYRDPNPEQARRVVQSLLTIFVESSLGDKRKDTQSAVKFLDEQIKRYEDSLRNAENRLKDFRLKYLGVADRESDYFRKLTQVKSEIENARMELQSYEQVRDSYKRELVGEVPNLLAEQPAATDTAAIEATPVLDNRIQHLKAEIDALLRKYTDAHPDVQAGKRLLAQLEAERDGVIAARKKAAASRPATPAAAAAPSRNPVGEQLRLSLADAEASVASARAKLDGYEAQYKSLRAQAQLVPQAEAELAELNRDYDVQKKTYENLLARREAASMGKDVQDTGGPQFRVIDPPRVSPDPVFPNRIVLLAAACLVSVLIGLLASLVASQLMPTVHDSRSLREIARRPILGMVAMVPSDARLHQLRRDRVLFATTLSSLFAAFAAVFAFALLVGRVA